MHTPAGVGNIPQNRLQEAVKHLRHNTEFEYVVDHIRAQHVKLWRQFLRDQSGASSEMLRGKAAAYADLYSMLTGKEILE